MTFKIKERYFEFSGTVRFWDASGISLKLIYKLSTAQLFVSEDLGGDGAAAEDDDWPPFRKSGLFDPYSDDPRLGIKKMEMCAFTGDGRFTIMLINPIWIKEDLNPI